MMRRMVRDMQFRNYNPRQTLHHWHLVRRSELRYIISRLRDAHVVVNSYLAYELPIWKARLSDTLLSLVKELEGTVEREDARERALRVTELFERFPAWSNEELVPGDSLLREFIGGSVYTY
jgi:uridine kinase